MHSKKLFGIRGVVFLTLLFGLSVCDEDVCNRRPLGTKTDPLPPDNQFLIEINGLIENLYIPKKEYIVRLRSRDAKSTFIAFTIALKEDTLPNRNNPRKPIHLNAGRLTLMPNSTTTRYKQHCDDTVVELDITPKTFVEALWTAPDKDNKCVTVFAVVAVQPDVWYNYEGPLSKWICEDRRKADDIQPLENDNCQACEDARYQLTFEGTWSYNTHPSLFPKSRELARFSDVVGASHSKDFSLYKYTSEASLGLKLLAEQGNSTKLEIEIQKQLGTSVRTVIKASAPYNTSMSTVTNFRATREHHLISLATALLPSPDWFLGVANLELCSIKTNQWTENITFNLYPMDAGTDKGLTFEAPNEEMSPPQPISPAKFIKEIPKELMKPFARLRLKLVRTYSTTNCSMEIEEPVTSEGDNDADAGNDKDREHNYITDPPVTTPPTTTTSEEPPSVDPASSDDCPLSTWEEWFPCQGVCNDGKIKGIQIRLRYRMVDGVAVGKYFGEEQKESQIPEECLDKYSLSDTRECEETCDNESEAVDEDNVWDDTTSELDEQAVK